MAASRNSVEERMKRPVMQTPNATFEGTPVGSVEDELDSLSKALGCFAADPSTETLNEAAAEEG